MMMKTRFSVFYIFLIATALFTSCGDKQEYIAPTIQDITESVYAAGVIKSDNQYQAFATVSGIVSEVFVDEGSQVEIGSPLLFIANDAQELMTENAQLLANYNGLYMNRGKLNEAKKLVILTRSQLQNDSSLLERKRRLWDQNIGTKATLDQQELLYKNSKYKYEAAIESSKELTKQLNYLSQQANNNLSISNTINNDYLVKSKIKGKVYQMNLVKGEMVTPQKLVAILGDDDKFLLEMEVDEYDIVSIKLGMPVLVVLNSYKDSVYTAVVSKINPIMNIQSKTFTIEAEFVEPPGVLFPNISFEANVVVHTKKNAMLIPRNYLLNDTTVLDKEGNKLLVKTGLKDYQRVEIVSGIDVDTELILPEQ